MTVAFGLTLAGAILIVSAIRDQSIGDVLSGVTATPTAGDGGGAGSGFTRAILDDSSALLVGNGGGSSVPGKPGKLPAGLVQFDGKPVAAWIARELRKARERGWGGTVNSGYRSPAEQAAACANTSGPCAAPGKSNHQGTAWPRGAVDVTEYDELDRILRSMGSPLKGFTVANDPVHFSAGG